MLSNQHTFSEQISGVKVQSCERATKFRITYINDESWCS